MHVSPSRRALVAALTLWLLAPIAAVAHADLDVPTPADGAAVEGTPVTVEATFTERLQADGSSLQLRDASGALVASGGPLHDDPTVMRIDPLPELAPGTYEVRWTSLSAEDPHVERGTWSFTVAAALTPAPTPEPTPSADASEAPSAEPPPSPTLEPTPAPSPIDEDPAGASGDVLLPILAGLAIVVVAGVVLLTRRGRPSGT